MEQTVCLLMLAQILLAQIMVHVMLHCCIPHARSPTPGAPHLLYNFAHASFHFTCTHNLLILLHTHPFAAFSQALCAFVHIAFTRIQLYHPKTLFFTSLSLALAHFTSRHWQRREAADRIAARGRAGAVAGMRARAGRGCPCCRLPVVVVVLLKK